uniref:Uncharacterized protein n=1 Tax=Cyclophora tenuis TaxID=216820 RepID=A0A7S1D3W4_CYCTE
MKNWHIVQTHHDYCDPSGLPTAVEDEFHEFDGVCDSCDIKRTFIPNAPTCPMPNCTDSSGSNAYAKLVELGCTTGCATNQTCRDNYTTLRVVHDSCPDGALPEAAEVGLHDFEGPCETVICNAPGSELDQTTCANPASSGTMQNMVALVTTAALTGAAMVLA